MKKFILYAGMAFILSFYAVANIEAGSKNPFDIKKSFDIKKTDIDIASSPTDPCAGGDVDCTYLFTAKDGSNKQITMARRETKEYDEYSSTDWYEYPLPVFTKTEVQAGYYLEDGVPVLVMVYSADKEGKGGAIVCQTSTDYGNTWSASINISDNQHKFGLSVAPNSRYVAIQLVYHVDTHLKEPKEMIVLKYLVDPDSSWFHYTDSVKEDHSISSYGLSLISNGNRVVVSYIGNEKSEKREFTLASKQWAAVSDMSDYKKHSSDTAWLCNDTGTNSGFYLAARRKNSSGKKQLGVHPTDDLINYSSFSRWNDYNADGELPISGMWKCPVTNKLYILALDGKELVGIDSSGVKTTLYENGYGYSLQRRVSMFNVPAK